MNFNGYSSEDFLSEAILNNTFTLSSVENSINNIIHNSFNFLYETQKNLVGLNRCNKTNDDFYIENDKICLAIPKDFIEQHARKAYRLSPYFEQELTLDDINNNRSIFVKMPLVFIDGLSTFNFTVKAYKDKTILIFPYNRDLIKSYHDITVLFVFNNGYKEIKSNKYIIDKYGNDLPSHFFGEDLNTDNDASILSFASVPNNNIGSTFGIGTLSKSRVGINPSSYASSIIYNNRSVNIQVVNTKYIYSTEKEYLVKERADGTLSCELVVIEDVNGKLYNMPIPVENIVVLKFNNDKNDYIIDNNIEVVLHYPNIYEIKDKNITKDDKYRVFYFYHISKDTDKYRNKIHSYLNLIKEKDLTSNGSSETALNNIYFGTQTENTYLELFEKYFNIKDFVYVYNHSDFFETLRPYHFDYKIDKLKSFIHEYSEHLRTYLNNQYDIGHNYYLFTKNIDLNSRIRENNYNETTRPSDLETFDEPCYLFSFRNESSVFLDLRFFVDGILYNPEYHCQSNGLEYIYIPTRLITENSYIEIERFDSFIFDQSIVFKEFGDEITLNILSGNDNIIKPTKDDIYFINEYTNEYIAPELITIYTSINNKDFSLNDFKYSKITKITLKLEDTSLYKVPIRVKISKRPYMSIVNNNTNTTMVTTQILKEIKKNSEYVRVFHNGRLLPNEAWHMADISGTNRARLLLKYNVKAGDVVTFDVTPYKYKLIYKLQRIPENGLIDLSQIVNKPADLKWYDMYLNGRKLSEANVIYVSPTKIQLINIKSFYNLYIYEKDRDPEYFYLDYNDNSYIITEDELLDDDNLSEEDKDIIINDIINNNKPDEVEVIPNEDGELDIEDGIDSSTSWDELDMIAFFEDVFFKVNPINPDLNQFLYSAVSKYSIISRHMKTDKHSHNNIPNVIHMNPDISINANNIIKIDPYELSLKLDVDNSTKILMTDSNIQTFNSNTLYIHSIK